MATLRNPFDMLNMGDQADMPEGAQMGDDMHLQVMSPMQGSQGPFQDFPQHPPMPGGQPPPGGPMGGIGQGMDQYFNQDRVDRRVNSARDQLERYGKSRGASNRSDLASRGTLGSGPEITAMNRSEEAIGDKFSNAISDIYANEGQQADSMGLGYGRLGLDQDALLGQLSQGKTSQLLQLLQLMYGGANTSAGGHI